MILVAVGILGYDMYRELLYRRAMATPGVTPIPAEPEWRWRTTIALGLLAWGPILLAFSIVVVPSGMAGVRVSQTSGTLPGTLYPGVHFVEPLVEDVALYDIRDQVFTTGGSEDGKETTAKVGSRPQLLDVQAKEGLTLGLAITVRYRLDPKHLDYVQSNLPHPVEKEIVPPIVASAWRELVPRYTVRDVFSAKREEVRERATTMITQKLAADGIVVKEVMLRDIQLPPEYAKGLEALLLKEQENDRMNIELEVKKKMVTTAELESDAQKAREIKAAEARASIVVLEAKAQADAMQHTLPLKLKQIEQSKLEAEARKAATVKNAEALAEAKVIDSKAELTKRNLMSESDEYHIRRVANADAERMKLEASVLKENPLLIQKIIAERLSDKVQIMMVPNDGKFFFANDVLKGMTVTGH
jgi:regulator of protease activity HflC (stomatin/prohibitin superfamily)